MRASKQRALLLTGCLTALASALGVRAQTNIGLSLQLYAGLSVTGTVGRVYQVQYATGLSGTNMWYALQHFELKWNPHEYVDTACPASERRFYRAVEVEVPANVAPVANMVFIPPGVFVMGSPSNEPVRWDDEGPPTEVTISRGFWMGAFEVTQEEYVSVIGNNPSYYRNGTNALNGGTGGVVTNELRHPVERVTWYDATNYCGQLTARELAAGRLPMGYEYRLPTEAEWEYACRAGTTTAFHYGAALRSGMANFDGRYEYPPCGWEMYYCYNPLGIYLGRTTEVGSYAPSAWGLYDMHGNLFEWCQDWREDSLPGGSVTDPRGPATGSARVFRGGYLGIFYDSATSCRSGYRGGNRPDYRTGVIGFRIVLASIQP